MYRIKPKPRALLYFEKISSSKGRPFLCELLRTILRFRRIHLYLFIFIYMYLVLSLFPPFLFFLLFSKRETTYTHTHNISRMNTCHAGYQYSSHKNVFSFSVPLPLPPLSTRFLSAVLRFCRRRLSFLHNVILHSCKPSPVLPARRADDGSRKDNLLNESSSHKDTCTITRICIRVPAKCG